MANYPTTKIICTDNDITKNADVISKIICTDNDITKNADVISKTEMILTLVIEGTVAKMRLFKQNPSDSYYVVNIGKLEFISTGL